MLPLAVQAAMAAIEKICPEAKNLLLIPEKHTRNTLLPDERAAADADLPQAGLNVRLGSLDETITGRRTLALPDGSALTLEPLVRTPRPAGAEGLRPLHHPAQQRPVGRHAAGAGEPARAVPAAAAARRLGGAAQDATTSTPTKKWPKKFAKLLGMDPWLINPMFAKCGEVNFEERQRRRVPDDNVDALLAKVAASTRNTASRRSRSSSSRPTPAPTAWAS